MFGTSVTTVHACDTKLVGAVGSQVGDESFGHSGIYVYFLPVVFDLKPEEITVNLLKDRGKGPQMKMSLSADPVSAWPSTI